MERRAVEHSFVMHVAAHGRRHAEIPLKTTIAKKRGNVRVSAFETSQPPVLHAFLRELRQSYGHRRVLDRRIQLSLTGRRANVNQ